jgi:hypothetical protein
VLTSSLDQLTFSQRLTAEQLTYNKLKEKHARFITKRDDFVAKDAEQKDGAEKTQVVDMSRNSELEKWKNGCRSCHD